MKRIFIVLAMALVFASCNSDSEDNPGADNTIIITGQVIVDSSVNNASLSALSLVEKGQVFAHGQSGAEIVETDATGKFTLIVSNTLISSAVRSSQGNLVIYAWKTVTVNERLGVAREINVTGIKNFDMGPVSLKWTNAGHFTLHFPDSVSAPFPLGKVEVKGIGTLEAINSGSDGKFDVPYLPTGRTYSLKITLPGYQILTYDFLVPEAGAADAWFTVGAVDMPALVPGN
jgi:hypothetical protein